MEYFVNKGAKLKCPWGSEQSELEVVHIGNPVLLCGKLMANIADNKPVVNIKPFGKCSSMANPAVAAATAANYGRLQKMPCVPITPFPWVNGKMNLIINGSPALLSTSKCACSWSVGRLIEVSDPGQNSVYVGGPMNITINEPTPETQQALGGGLLSSQDGVASSSQALQSSSSAMQSSLSSSSSASAAQSSSSAAQVSVKTKIEKSKLSIVIDRYKMPGLNADGSDIADDMCFGFGIKSSRPIYTETTVGNYKKEYEENGFSMLKHKFFSNEGNRIDSKSIYDNKDIPIFAKIVKEVLLSLTDAGKIRALYTAFKKVIELLKDNDEDKLLFDEFKTMASEIFASSDSEMRENINAMIDKFKRNEGGIYENVKLTSKIEKHDSTNRYCQQLERYIKRKLKECNGEDISKLEDKEVDFKLKGKSSREVKEDRIENKDKNFDLTPVYDSISFSLKKLLDIEKWGNTFGGATIALNDIWATEVMITEYNLTGSKYSGKYQVTLWDHFGLNVEDIEWNKLPGYLDGFRAWFLLQHFKGYKPFITKITFERKFNGDLKDEVV